MVIVKSKDEERETGLLTDANIAISSTIKEDPQLIRDYKKLAKKIRDDYRLEISDEEIDEYFHPCIQSEASALTDYYRLLNIFE